MFIVMFIVIFNDIYKSEKLVYDIIFEWVGLVN